MQVHIMRIEQEIFNRNVLTIIKWFKCLNRKRFYFLLKIQYSKVHHSMITNIQMNELWNNTVSQKLLKTFKKSLFNAKKKSN
jgi:hypothetical protein